MKKAVNNLVLFSNKKNTPALLEKGEKDEYQQLVNQLILPFTC